MHMYYLNPPLQLLPHRTSSPGRSSWNMVELLPTGVFTYYVHNPSLPRSALCLSLRAEELEEGCITYEGVMECVSITSTLPPPPAFSPFPPSFHSLPRTEIG